MSRKRKSQAEHELAGTTPEWAEQQPSQFQAGRPRMPKHLSPVAQEKWKEMVRLLAKRGVLTKVDSTALEIFCETYARWRMLLEEIQKHGALVETVVLDNNGEPHTKRVPNPASKLAAQLETSQRQMLKEFTATPASRDKAKPAAPEKPKAEAFPEGSSGWLLEQANKGAFQNADATDSPRL